MVFVPDNENAGDIQHYSEEDNALKTNNVSEMALQVCYALIARGVKGPNAWADYSHTYLPIVRYFEERGHPDYEAEILNYYRETVRKAYDAEEISTKTWQAKMRAANRLQEFCETNDLSHVCTGIYARTKLYPYDESLLHEFLDSEKSVSVHTKKDMD